MELYRTSSGESTLYLPHLDETYHSRHGAISESNHVFIEQGLHKHAKWETDEFISVLEIGFGTGLNALLALHTGRKIDYTTTEPFPVKSEIINELSYGEQFGLEREFLEMHQCEWEQKIAISQHFNFVKHLCKLEDLSMKNNSFDVVFFDAFAIKKQPELWSVEVFDKVYKSMAEGGILTTYAAAGQIKRNMKEVGFALTHPPGANGKREMTVATK